MQNILQAVAYDSISLLKIEGENNNGVGIDKNTLIKIRMLSNRLRPESDNNDFIFANDKVRDDFNNASGAFTKRILEKHQIKKTELIESVKAHDWLVYLIYESSVLTRTVFSYFLDAGIRGLLSNSSYNGERDKDFLGLPIINKYLKWYVGVLSSILNDEIIFNEDKTESSFLNELNDYRVKLKRIDHDLNLKVVLSGVSDDVQKLRAEVKADLKQFVDHTMISIGDTLSKNKNTTEKTVAKVNSLFLDFQEVRKKQSEYLQDIELVNEYCNKRKENIDSIFTAANRQGMAKSFLHMADSLQAPMKVWACIFVFSLLLIASAGLYLNEHQLNLSQSQNMSLTHNGVDINPKEKQVSSKASVQEIETEGLSYISILVKALVISPLIWLAWFSGRQFGHASKLRQDYSYKSAIAMAYQGYKEEANGASSDMHGKLLENIVLHFSENPVRLYERCDSASPLEEILNKIPKEKLSDIIKAIKN